MTAGTAEFDLPDIDAGDALVQRLVGFQAFLREQGYLAGIPEAQDALRVASIIGVTDRRRLRAGMQSLLCSGHREWERFGELFDAYFMPPNRSAFRESRGGGANDTDSTQLDSRPSSHLIESLRQGGDGGTGIAGDEAAQGGASEAESLEKKDVRVMTQEEVDELERLVDRLAARMCRRMVRRQKISAKAGKLHLRRTLRNSLQTGGVPIDLSYRQRRRKPPHLVVLLDVSRSMSIYTYLMLRFTRAIVRSFRRADAFIFHTRLVPITDALKETNADRMRDRLTLLSQGWGGGTRIGECLRAFNDRYAGALVSRRTAVVLVSDGYDTGSPELLGREMERLHARAHRVIWLNPLLGRLNYEPVAGGMAAALPHIDMFAPAHNLESLLALESELVRL
jgi:uncharacterized protein with von Willebrand factor type A (vWA) domain